MFPQGSIKYCRVYDETFAHVMVSKPSLCIDISSSRKQHIQYGLIVTLAQMVPRVLIVKVVYIYTGVL